MKTQKTEKVKQVDVIGAAGYYYPKVILAPLTHNKISVI